MTPYLVCGQCRHFTGERYPNDGRPTIWNRCAALNHGVMADTTAAEFCPRFLPPRIQFRRTRGWRKPEGAVVVSRPSRWGNPFPIGVYVNTKECRQLSEDETRRLAVAEYRRALLAGELRVTVEDVRRELRGKALCCWCRIDAPCHADVLLEVAHNPVSTDDENPRPAEARRGEEYQRLSMMRLITNGSRFDASPRRPNTSSAATGNRERFVEPLRRREVSAS